MRTRGLTPAALALVAALVPLLSVRGGGDVLRPEAAVAQGVPLNVPKAQCGPNDRVETGLQGQTTLAERFSGASMQAYNCNLELVGQFEGEGAGWQFASFDNCGYFGTANNTTQQQRGTVTVDVSDPTTPRPTAYLTARAMLDPWESLKVNQRRKLLGATKGLGRDPNDKQFAFYDIKDCANPRLLADVEFADHIGHAGDFAPDGLTYYGTTSVGPGITAVDITDPTRPKEILRDLQFVVHDIMLSNDGTRMYAALLRPGNGVIILDVSDIQYRRPNPQIREISRITWPDGRASQVPTRITIQGKPYLLHTDEASFRATSCAQGLSPFGMARLIDISDERTPAVVSKLMLEIHDPANCAQTLADLVGFPGFGYDVHYCSVDNPRNAKLAGCGHFQAGLRVFDIRDPRHPKEIAYYKPPARRTEFRPGSNMTFVGPFDHTADWASSNVRFVRAKGDLQIWFTSQDNGFQVVRFTNGLLARTGLDRFDQDHAGNRN